MSLKEELEVLRGCPIHMYDCEPMDIPCIETSDPERLCKKPVVSVHMITYNHEPYIRQAIEGVMMQKTDFEFELVIGEDCSKDRTREICLEFQKKYPDKIRVLWWHENVSKHGGNGRRVLAHCRGEFDAYCEGDDYWVDPNKLQKQVNLMRQYPNAGICFGAIRFYYQSSGKVWAPSKRVLRRGVQRGEDFVKSILLSQSLHGRRILQTSGNLIRKSVMVKARKLYEIFSWKLLIGDTLGWLAYASISDVCYLPDIVSTYRINAGGVTQRRFSEIMRDDLTVRIYFCMKTLGMSFHDAALAQEKSIVRMVVNSAAIKTPQEQRAYAVTKIDANPLIREFFSRLYARPLYLLMKIGLLKPRLAFWLNRIYWYMPRFGVFK